MNNTTLLLAELSKTGYIIYISCLSEKLLGFGSVVLIYRQGKKKVRGRDHICLSSVVVSHWLIDEILNLHNTIYYDKSIPYKIIGE